MERGVSCNGVEDVTFLRFAGGSNEAVLFRFAAVLPLPDHLLGRGAERRALVLGDLG